jgi:hypothetical protein
MSAMQGAPREKWMGPRESDFAAVRNKLAALEKCWVGDLADLKRLTSLAEESIAQYQAGNEQAGTFAWKAADELQQNVRDKVYKVRRLRASNDPEA